MTVGRCILDDMETYHRMSHASNSRTLLSYDASHMHNTCNQDSKGANTHPHSCAGIPPRAYLLTNFSENVPLSFFPQLPCAVVRNHTRAATPLHGNRKCRPALLFLTWLDCVATIASIHTDGCVNGVLRHSCHDRPFTHYRLRDGQLSHFHP